MTKAFLATLARADNDTIINKTRAIDAVFRVLIQYAHLFERDMSARDIIETLESCLTIVFPRFDYGGGYLAKFVAYNAIQRGYLVKNTIEFLGPRGNVRTRINYNFS